MKMKRLHLGSVSFGPDSLEELRAHVAAGPGKRTGGSGRLLHLHQRVHEALLALAVAHNVTPLPERAGFQASSPDEVALVEFARDAGLQLVERSPDRMRLERGAAPAPAESLAFEILALMPFTSETKVRRLSLPLASPRRLTCARSGWGCWCAARARRARGSC
jgi:phospholipid-translocating ATPase